MIIFYSLLLVVLKFSFAFTLESDYIDVVNESSDEDFDDSSASSFESPREYETLNWKSFEWFNLVPGGEVLTNFKFSSNWFGVNKVICFMVSAVASRWQGFQEHEELLHFLGKELFNIRRVDGKIAFINFVKANVKKKHRPVVLILIFRYILLESQLEIEFVHCAYEELQVQTNCLPIDAKTASKLIAYIRRNPGYFSFCFRK